MMSLSQAVVFARRVHAGQTDAAGEPYILHPLAVLHLVQHAGCDVSTQIVAVLHDVVEDGLEGTLDQLIEAGLSADDAVSLASVTRQRGSQFLRGVETYADLIARAAADDRGRVVKLFDNAHNSLPSRTALLSPERQEFNARRYTRAGEQLLAAEQARRQHGVGGTFPVESREAFLSYVAEAMRSLPDDLLS